MWNKILENGAEWSKTIISVGFAGIVAWYLLTKSLPDAQDKFHDEMAKERAATAKMIREERDANAERARKAREHAKESVKEMGDSIRMMARMLDTHQAEIRDNQWRQIELQKKAMKDGTP